MTRIVRAEALLTFDGECNPETLAVAKAAGIMAARRCPDLVPYSQPTAAKIEIEISAKDGTTRIAAALEAETGGEAQALTAAAVAAITLAEMDGAALQSVKLAAAVSSAPKPFARKAPIARIAKPAAPMGLVGAPAPLEGKIDRREAFRAFMTSHHLRAPEWAKQAGVPAAIVYAFLTGRTNTLAAEVAEKLANAANATVEDMFK